MTEFDSIFKMNLDGSGWYILSLDPTSSDTDNDGCKDLDELRDSNLRTPWDRDFQGPTYNPLDPSSKPPL